MELSFRKTCWITQERTRIFYGGVRGDLTLRQNIIYVWHKRLCYNKTGSVSTSQDWDAFLRPSLQWKSNSYYVCRMWVCILRYTACSQPCCHLWSVRLHYIFPRYLINGIIFGKGLLNIEYVFRFSLQLMSEIFLILKTTKIRRSDSRTLLSYMCMCVYIYVYTHTHTHVYDMICKTNPKIAKCDLVSSCPSVHMQQLGSHWTDFYGISYLSIFQKSVEKISSFLKIWPE